MARLEEQKKTEEVVMEPKEKQPMYDEDCTDTCIVCGVGCIQGISKVINEEIFQFNGRIRDIEEISDGSLIIVNDEYDGGVYRLFK